MASLVQTLRRLCGAARASTPDMALIVCVFICIDLFSLAVGVDPSSTSFPSDVPILYRLPCEQIFCDGRTKYCDNSVPNYPNCSFCADLCGPDGPYTECKEKCKVYLLYKHEQKERERQERKWNLMKDTVASENEKTRRELAEMKAENESHQNIAIVSMVLSMVVIMMVVSAVALLIYVIRQMRQMNWRYRPVTQEIGHIDKESGLGDKESGFGTTNNTVNNTPEILRRADAQSGEQPENLPLSIITSPAQDPHNTRDTPAPQV